MHGTPVATSPQPLRPLIPPNQQTHMRPMPHQPTFRPLGSTSPHHQQTGLVQPMQNMHLQQQHPPPQVAVS